MSTAVTIACMKRLPLGKFMRFEKCKDNTGREFTLLVWMNHDTGKQEKYDTRTGEKSWR